MAIEIVCGWAKTGIKKKTEQLNPQLNLVIIDVEGPMNFDY